MRLEARLRCGVGEGGEGEKGERDWGREIVDMCGGREKERAN